MCRHSALIKFRPCLKTFSVVHRFLFHVHGHFDSFRHNPEYWVERHGSISARVCVYVCMHVKLSQSMESSQSERKLAIIWFLWSINTLKPDLQAPIWELLRHFMKSKKRNDVFHKTWRNPRLSCLNTLTPNEIVYCLSLAVPAYSALSNQALRKTPFGGAWVA